MKNFALVAALVCAAIPAFAVPVSVTVVGPDNQPLAEATLSVAQGAYPIKPDAQPRTVAGVNGRFAFEWDGEFSGQDAKDRRTVDVLLKAPGMATEMRRLNGAQTTVHLQRARSFGGLVTDAAQKPVVGARVELNRWSAIAPDGTAKTENGAAFYPVLDAWKRSVTTDAAGRWRFDDLTARASASFSFTDARFVTQFFDANTAEKEAPPLFAKLGASITGVLLALDGTPLPDVTVSAGRSGQNRTRTDAAGRFTVTGVEPGETKLQSGSFYWQQEQSAEHLIPSIDKVSMAGGQTTDVGAWKAVKGVLVKASIVDEQTKKPLQTASLQLWGNGNRATLKSDEQGRISGRVLPENLGDSGSLGSVTADGYVQTQIARPVTAKESETLDLGTITLARGIALTGTVRVEGEVGATILNAPSLMLMNGGNWEPIHLWRGQRDFVTQTLKPGNYSVQLGSTKTKDWELVSPQTVRVPAPGEKGAEKGAKIEPLEIVLRRLTPATPLLGLVSGRVTDGAGNGIGGATVKGQLRAGNTYTRAEVLTQSDGSFQLERSDPRLPNHFAADGFEIKIIERPGYFWASQPKFETAAGATTISNLTMKKRGAVFAGRVVDANGKGAAGAWVAVLEMRDLPLVQVGADGRFEMIDLPIEKFVLIGADSSGFGSAKTEASATNFELKLTPNPTPNREALAERALDGAIELGDAQAYGRYLDTVRRLAVLERTAESQRGYNALNFALDMERHDPQALLRNAPALLEFAGTARRQDLEAKIYALRAVSDEADDRIAANAWLDEQKGVKREIKADSVTQLLQMALVAQKLKREDAAQWLDYAAAIAAQLRGNGSMSGWAEPLAQLGGAAMAPFVEEMKPTVEFDFWYFASAELARQGDIAGAKRALARMEALTQTPEFIEQDKNRQGNSRSLQIMRARAKVALQLANSDAAGALEMKPSNKEDWDFVNQLLFIADRAIVAKDAATAEKALRQIMQMRNGNIENFALAASLAQGFDVKLGAELWADALKRALPDKDDEFDPFRPSVGMWAFYHASLDAGQSRVLLEREWNWRLPAAAAKPKGEENALDRHWLSQLTMGMAAVDPVRALEMHDEARAKTSKADATPAANIGLAAAILATPAERARMGLNSY